MPAMTDSPDLFQFCPIWAAREVSKGYFLRSYEKLTHKMYHITKTRNVKFELFELVTLDDLDGTPGHQRLRRVLRGIPSRSIGSVSI